MIAGLEENIASGGEECKGGSGDWNHVAGFEYRSRDTVDKILGAYTHSASYKDVCELTCSACFDFALIALLLRAQRNRLIEDEHEVSAAEEAPRGDGNEVSRVVA